MAIKYLKWQKVEITDENMEKDQTKCKMIKNKIKKKYFDNYWQRRSLYD